MKKRTKKTDIPIVTTGYPGLSSRDAQARMDEESAMQAEMRDIIETDEKRNDLETYIFETRDKITEGRAWGAFISNADRDKLNGVLMTAEDWLYDTYEATKTQYVEKLTELKTLGDPVQWRFNEDGMRDEWVKAVQGTIQNYKQAVANPGDKYGHIAQDKLQKITQSCNELQKWLDEMSAKQAQVAKCDKPALLCADMEKKNQELAKCADEILKEPKPAPPKEEKKEEPPKDEKKEPTSPKKEGEAPTEMDVD
jgi:heat shock protein 4